MKAKPNTPVEKKEKDTTNVSAEIKEMLEPFIASKSFVGSKKGYFFSTGDLGLGYYLDVPRKSLSKKLVQFSEKSNSITFEYFPFEYRQTKEAVAVLVQVENIIGDSVKINFSSNGFDLAFTALSDGTEKKYYCMRMECMHEISETKCKYDVASLNMVLALTKKDPVYWREDKLIDPDMLSDFEKVVKKSLGQPINILRLHDGSEDIKKACVSAIGGILSGESKTPKLSTQTTTASPKKSVAYSPSQSSKQTSDTTSETAAHSIAETGSSKMKFTVGALLDLD